MTGLLNGVAWSETTRLIRKISGLLDPRVGRQKFSTFHTDFWFHADPKIAKSPKRSRMRKESLKATSICQIKFKLSL